MQQWWLIAKDLIMSAQMEILITNNWCKTGLQTFLIFSVKCRFCENLQDGITAQSRTREERIDEYVWRTDT